MRLDSAPSMQPTLLTLLPSTMKSLRALQASESPNLSSQQTLRGLKVSRIIIHRICYPGSAAANLPSVSWVADFKTKCRCRIATESYFSSSFNYRETIIRSDERRLTRPLFARKSKQNWLQKLSLDSPRRRPAKSVISNSSG